MLENLKNQSMQVQFAEDEEVYTFEPEEVKDIEPPSSWFGLIKSLTTDGMKTMWKIGFLGSLLTGVQLTILAFYFVEIFGVNYNLILSYLKSNLSKYFLYWFRRFLRKEKDWRMMAYFGLACFYY